MPYFLTCSSRTSDTVQPPQPAPVSRAPMAPASLAMPTSLSSSGQEHSYRSLRQFEGGGVPCVREGVFRLQTVQLGQEHSYRSLGQGGARGRVCVFVSSIWGERISREYVQIPAGSAERGRGGLRVESARECVCLQL